MLGPEDEGTAPLSDFGAVPPERRTGALPESSFGSTTVKHYAPEPFEAAVIDGRTIFVGEFVSLGAVPVYNTEDGLAPSGDITAESENVYPALAHQEVVVEVRRVLTFGVDDGAWVSVRFEVSEPDFEWIAADHIGQEVLVAAYEASYPMVDGTEVTSLTLLPDHTYLIGSDRVCVRLYSPTASARYERLVTMDDPPSRADRVPLSDLIQRATAPSQDRADWLGGERPSEQEGGR